MKSKLSLLALSALLLGGLVACGPTTSSSADGGSSDTPNTSSETPNTSEEVSSAATGTAGDPNGKHISMWISKNDLNALTALVDGYNAKYPNETVYVTATELEEGKVGDAYTQDPDNVPDIAHVPGDVVHKLIDNGYIAAFPKGTLDTYMGNDIEEGALAAGQDQGMQYALPFSLNTFFMYYNKAVFTNPEDLESLADMEAVLADEDKTFGLDMANGWYIQSFFMSNGKGIMKDNGTSLTETWLGSDEALYSAKAIAHCYQNPDLYLIGAGEVLANGVKSGSCAAYLSGSWDYSNAAAWGEENVGMTILPKFDLNGVPTQLLSVGDFKSIVVSNSSKEKDAAQKFAAYMNSAEGQLARWLNNGKTTVPTSNTVSESEEYKDGNKFAEVMGEVLKHTFIQDISLKFTTNWWDSATAFANAVRDLAKAGQVTDENLRAKLADLESALLA